MLKPVIAGFLNVYFIDYLLFSAVFATAAFLLDWRVPGPSDRVFERMHGADYWQYWLLAAAGWALALVLRLVTRRGLPLRVLPSETEAAGAAYHGFLTALAVLLALFLYRLRIDDPGSALVEPFAIGIVLSAAAVCCVLLAAVVIEFYMGTPGVAPVHLTLTDNRNVAGGAGVLAIMTFDLLVLEHGHWMVLFVAGALVLMWIGSLVLQAVPGQLRRVSRP